MNYLKKFGIFLLLIGVISGLAQAAEEKGKPDATVRLKAKSVAAGVGFSWGKGTLTYKGKEYAVKVDGLSLGKVGISGGSAAGEVYNLNKLSDFDGHYNAGGAGMTVAAGKNMIALKNQNGVKVLLHSNTRGVDLTVAGGGVEMEIKK